MRILSQAEKPVYPISTVSAQSADFRFPMLFRQGCSLSAWAVWDNRQGVYYGVCRKKLEGLE